MVKFHIVRIVILKPNPETYHRQTRRSSARVWSTLLQYMRVRQDRARCLPVAQTGSVVQGRVVWRNTGRLRYSLRILGGTFLKRKLYSVILHATSSL